MAPLWDERHRPRQLSGVTSEGGFLTLVAHLGLRGWTPRNRRNAVGREVIEERFWTKKLEYGTYTVLSETDYGPVLSFWIPVMKYDQRTPDQTISEVNPWLAGFRVSEQASLQNQYKAITFQRKMIYSSSPGPLPQKIRDASYQNLLSDKRLTLRMRPSVFPNVFKLVEAFGLEERAVRVLSHMTLRATHDQYDGWYRVAIPLWPGAVALSYIGEVRPGHGYRPTGIPRSEGSEWGEAGIRPEGVRVLRPLLDRSGRGAYEAAVRYWRKRRRWAALRDREP